ncbi:ferredoxin [Nocardioides marmoriginsengisoli]|uniref:Ferredoxin n=1 Tax=Nocardioides marmoriginsengisoli TaxID=661483 RepID=A0A3N0CIY1_9ACTN|nr:ferredoxin [Nocardioides marmoriginsengisoli]RNL63385.1 ferredoxin [Nocardioides marmoriginsengisoli]
MRIEVDAPKCVTSGQCVMIAPDVFDQDDDGIVIVLDENPAEGQRGVVEESAAVCPAAAIFVIED